MRLILPLLLAVPLLAQPDLVPEPAWRAIFGAVSARQIMEDTEALSRRHRYPNSLGFLDAAAWVQERAAEAGLVNPRLERFDERAPFWDPVEATLDLLAPEARRLADLRDVPVLLMERSADGEIEGELVDAGEGSRAEDFANLDVAGKILLTRRSPGRLWPDLAKRGALGVLSAASPHFFGRAVPAEATAWQQAPRDAVAFSISPKLGTELAALRRQGPVRVKMRARSGQSAPGATALLLTEMPGGAPGRDVVVVAHLDHQQPGANDNASGSAAILEAARVWRQLIGTGALPEPRRRVRFWWATEISSEGKYFQRYPDEARNILLAVNLDQAGGERGADNHLIAILSPDWLPSWADDLIHQIAGSAGRLAPPEHAPSPLTLAPEGSQQPLRPVFWPYAPLSDHVPFVDRTVRVPAISLAVPSLSVIHTDFDSPARLDPTWLKRSAAVTLAAAAWAANAGPEEANALLRYSTSQAASRIAAAADRQAQLKQEERRLDSFRALDPALDIEPNRRRLRAVARALD